MALSADPHNVETANSEDYHEVGSHTASSSWNSNGTHGNTSSISSIADEDGVTGHEFMTSAPEPIAVVGIGLRLPGGISTPSAFWEFLLNKGRAVFEVPKDRFNIDAFHTSHPPASGRPARSGTLSTRRGHFLDCDLGSMDASFFSMSRAEVERLDPQQRLLLEVVWECMESGGQKGWKGLGADIGVYVGVFGGDWADLNAKDPQHTGMYRITGAQDFALSNRISYEFDLMGPSVTVETACSSSLVGLHQACQAIRAGECTGGAIVAGTNLILSPSMSVALTEQGVLSPSGTCSAFDAKADGYVRGEAVNAVFVKKLSDALRDGDPIRGVIRGSAANFDGKTPGMSNPSPGSQEMLMRRAYHAAGIPESELGKTAFVECHGTGTPVGDVMETSAVGRVFGEKGVIIGSVKPNVGHGEGASGLSSLIKVMLSLENRIIPPNANFSEPNPKIGWDKYGLKVPTEATVWPPDRLDRVSVNSFGIGGANAHIIVESARPWTNNLSRSHKERLHHLLLISASHPESLKETAARLEDFAGAYSDRLEDMSFTLATRRNHLAQRSFAIADRTSSDGSLGVLAPVVRAKGTSPSVNMVFTGQGAQWAGMGADLLREFDSFAADIDTMDEILQTLPKSPSWTIREELLRPINESRLDEPEFSQPICTALQIALVRLLLAANCCPAAVVGHSSGEIAAAYAAGFLSMHSAIAVAYYRGQATEYHITGGQGAMAAVGLGRNAVTPYLATAKGKVVLACENSPNSVTISGDAQALDAVIASIKTELPECFVRKLKVDRAYHSHHMAAIGHLYKDMLRDLVVDKGQRSVPFFSSVTGKLVTKTEYLGPPYWRTNLESPVLFYTAVQAMLQSNPSDTLFLEVGPHSALAGPLRDIFKSADLQPSQMPTYISSLTRNEHGTKAFLQAIGQLWQAAVPIDLAPLVNGGKVLTDLPPYAWHYDGGKYWSESRVARQWRLRTFGPHELLGIRVMESDDVEPAWRNILRLDDVSWLRDHKINDDVVLPGAAYIAMASEAVLQVSDPLIGYSLRHVDIKAALVLRESEAVELVTHLRPVRLTASLDSETWFEFTILSFNRGSWTKHCTGQVRAGIEGNMLTRDAPDIGTYPRNVPSQPWYRTMKAAGLNYGSTFQGLKDISAMPGKNTASARLMIPTVQEVDCHYELHPTTIDFCLQLFMVAIADGLSRRFTQTFMPTYIGELSICHGGLPIDATMQVEAQASINPNGAVTGTGIGVADGLITIQMRDTRLSALHNTYSSSGVDEDTIAGAKLHWRPDLDLVHAKDFIKPNGNFREASRAIERLSLVSMLSTLYAVNTIPNSEIAHPHLIKFRDWMLVERDRAAAGSYVTHVPEASRLVELTHNRSALAAELESARAGVASLGQDIAIPVADVISRCASHAEDLFRGAVEPIELLMRDNGLGHVYRYMQALCDITPYFALVGHARPTLRVLEIGAGTGGTTADVLHGLTSAGESLGGGMMTKKYVRYDYTDISTGFFAAAQTRFADFEGIEYRVLDISRDPLAQGFEAGTYDLIVASNVLHATPSLNETLSHVRLLLKTGGKLFLQELSLEWKMISYIMGFLSGWWLGDQDGRPVEPFVPVSRWDRELREAGFSGVDAAVFDDEQTFQINANIISTAVESNDASQTPQRPHVTLLCPTVHASHVFGQALQVNLEEAGFDVVFASSLDQLPKHMAADSDIISLLELEAPFFHDIPADRLKAVQDFLSRMPVTSRILWVTGYSQVGSVSDPRYASVLGAARTIRSELSIDFATIEVDLDTSNENSPASAAIGRLVADMYRKRFSLKRSSRIGKGVNTEEIEFGPDCEFAIVDDQVLLPRYEWVDVAKETDAAAKTDSKRALMLEAGRVGQLQTLRWVEVGLPISLQPEQVEIEPHAVGLNFKDVLVAMGIVEGLKPGLGIECAGVVRRVGPSVLNLSVGDRVVAFDHGCFSSSFVTNANLVAKIPDNLSFENAASMPCVYTTAIHALINIGRLTKDKSVLIHSACGGLGIAAINLCQMAGAKIFATVGNQDKAQYLVDVFDLPRDHIFSSRDASFYDDIMAATNGGGVDLVLNSLSGELLHLSWKCVAEWGTMLEVGKRDIIGRAALGMDLFENNRTFCGIDMSQMAVQRPWMYQEVLQQCMEFFRQGRLPPIPCDLAQMFNATNIIEAFRTMHRGQHIGKIVVTMSECWAGSEQLQVTPSAATRTTTFRPDVSYLLSGGLGGLGRAISTWMVENGARHLIYLARSGGSSTRDKTFVNELNAQGCAVQIFQGDVATLCDVENAIGSAIKPIAGVIHLSMTLRDRALLQVNHSDWHAVTQPKVDGAWNLHTALQSQSLDFFVLFSSLSAIMGQVGQANYAAANTYLTGLARHRHALGLPASVLDVGVMEDVGYVSENPAQLDQFRALGYHTVKEADLLDALGYMINNQEEQPSVSNTRVNQAQLVIGLRSTKPLIEPNNRTLWKRDPRMARAHLRDYASAASASSVSAATESSGEETLHRFVSSLGTQAATDPALTILDKQESREFLARQIGLRLCGFLFRSEEDLEMSLSPAAMGVDSLVAIEIRNWWRQAMGLDIGVLELMSAGSIRGLGELAAEGLKVEYGRDADAGEEEAV